jgi:hypothetical protein
MDLNETWQEDYLIGDYLNPVGHKSLYLKT